MNSKKKYCYFIKTMLVLFLFFSFVNGFSQSQPLSKNALVSIITCATGNESYSLFGHTAIRIKDIENNLDVVYNYGAFDFATPNFVAKFTKGDLQYFVVANSFSDFMSQYTFEQRSVYEQELLIPAVFKQKLFDNLNMALASDERFYTYKFIDKNCTSMVVELLNKTFDATIIVKKNDTEKTYRSILYPYFENSFYEKLGTSIIFGKKVDDFGTQIFLPYELSESLKLIAFQNHPICKESKTLLAFKNETSKSWWNNIYTFLLLLILVILVNKKSVNLVYFLLMGMLGIFFGFVGFYSFHQELSYNYNILLFNPLLIVLLYFNTRKKVNLNRNLITIFLNILSLIIYFIIMINKIHLLIVLPLIITNLILLARQFIYFYAKGFPVGNR